MQANRWADVLTTTPKHQAMRYEPSSPRASLLRSLPQAPRAHSNSAPLHTGSSDSDQQTRPNAQRLHAERAHGQRPDAKYHAGAHQRGPCYPQGEQSTANDNPGRGPRLALGADTPFARHQAARAEEPCKGAPRNFRPAVGEVALSKPEREEPCSPVSPCECHAQRQDVAYLVWQQYFIAEAP